jgi:hypothetical protein
MAVNQRRNQQSRMGGDYIKLRVGFERAHPFDEP